MVTLKKYLRPQQSNHVLVVEDEPALREMLWPPVGEQRLDGCVGGERLARWKALRDASRPSSS